MAVNRYRPHLVVVVEDDPYREMVNGAKLCDRVHESVIDVRRPQGGWVKVFAALDDVAKELCQYPEMRLLLLIDFDHEFSRRYQEFDNKCRQIGYQSRVFLLGADHREAEDLKKTLNLNFEMIGKKLVEGCPGETIALWKNPHLRHNLTEIERMRQAGVFQWLFQP